MGNKMPFGYILLENDNTIWKSRIIFDFIISVN